MQWKRHGSLPPKKAKVVSSTGKVMASVFWDCCYGGVFSGTMMRATILQGSKDFSIAGGGG